MAHTGAAADAMVHDLSPEPTNNDHFHEKDHFIMMLAGFIRHLNEIWTEEGPMASVRHFFIRPLSLIGRIALGYSFMWLAQLLPSYERGARGYTGFGTIQEILKGEVALFEFHWTLRATPERITDPRLYTGECAFYHGTNQEFIRKVIASGDAGYEVHASSRSMLGLFFSGPDVAYLHFVNKRWDPNHSPALIKIRTAVRRPSDHFIELVRLCGFGDPRVSRLALLEYYQSRPGELITSPKPLCGLRFGGQEELEFVMKPGTRLYPVMNNRCLSSLQKGRTKGSSFMVNPLTCQIIEVLEVTTSPQELCSADEICSPQCAEKD